MYFEMKTIASRCLPYDSLPDITREFMDQGRSDERVPGSHHQVDSDDRVLFIPDLKYNYPHMLQPTCYFSLVLPLSISMASFFFTHGPSLHPHLMMRMSSSKRLWIFYVVVV